MDLFVLLYLESGTSFNPNSKNPYSSARGLIQITNIAAKHIVDRRGNHFNNSKQITNEYSTVFEQLEVPNKYSKYGGPVYQLLKLRAPYKNSEDMIMCVLYPSYRNSNKNIPYDISKLNGNIKNAKDYIKLAYSKKNKDRLIYD